jgi:hypothetical protein
VTPGYIRSVIERLPDRSEDKQIAARTVATVGGEEYLILHPADQELAEYHHDGEWIAGKGVEVRP